MPIRQAKLHTMAQNLTCLRLFGSIEPYSAAESVGLSSQMHELTQFVAKLHVRLTPGRTYVLSFSGTRAARLLFVKHLM